MVSETLDAGVRDLSPALVPETLVSGTGACSTRDAGARDVVPDVGVRRRRWYLASAHMVLDADVGVRDGGARRRR
jgi:hypothetical protein